MKCGGGEECLCGVNGGIKTGQAVLFLLPEQCSCSSSLGDGMSERRDGMHHQQEQCLLATEMPRGETGG